MRNETLSKVLANYVYLTELWPELRADTQEPNSLAKIIGVEARMKDFSFLFGTSLSNQINVHVNEIFYLTELCFDYLFCTF